MKKTILTFLLILIPFFYFSKSARAGECLDDADCLADEICVNGFCELAGGDGDGDRECLDDQDCLEDEICDVGGFCIPIDGGGGNANVDEGGCSLIAQGPASKTQYLTLASYLLALGGISVWRRMKKMHG